VLMSSPQLQSSLRRFSMSVMDEARATHASFGSMCVLEHVTLRNCYFSANERNSEALIYEVSAAPALREIDLVGFIIGQEERILSMVRRMDAEAPHLRKVSLVSSSRMHRHIIREIYHTQKLRRMIAEAALRMEVAVADVELSTP
jgi:hypothetical protein